MKTYLAKLLSDHTVYGMGLFKAGTEGVCFNHGNYAGAEHICFNPLGALESWVMEKKYLSVLSGEIDAPVPPESPKYRGNFDKGFVRVTSELPRKAWLDECIKNITQNNLLKP